MADKKYLIYGEIAIIGENKVEITELPVGTWTQAYKESVLEPMLQGVNKGPAVIRYETFFCICAVLRTSSLNHFSCN